MHIHVGHNAPGYPPEGDLLCFTDADEALDALKGALWDAQSDYFQCCRAVTEEQRERGSDCCPWCSVAWDVEAAISAIVDSGPDSRFISSGRAHFQFTPPEGAPVLHWAQEEDEDADVCPWREEQ